jgi:hypothetical protein
MRVGTKSILFGVHNFVIHTAFLAAAWRRLYGFPRDPRLWLAFLLHDAGYFGKRSMEGREGETHVELGARIMGWLFGAEWAEFCRRHSRYYVRSRGLRISRLCVADKLAFALTPSWLYLPLARASGELWEYIERSKDRQAGSEYFTPAEWSQVNSQDPREWLKGLQSFTYRWVLKNRFADAPDLRAHSGHAGFVDRGRYEPMRLLPKKAVSTTYHLHRLGNSTTQILRDGFDPLVFRPELVNLSASHFEWGYGGCGPEVTTACILADFFESDEMALRFCGAFKARIIANLPRCSTWLTGNEILEALENLQIEWETAGRVSW